MAGLKTASGEAIDGSFELRVEVEQGPGAPRALALRVTGGLHVGGLMLLIVDTVGEQRDWSDHALWWAQRRQWLLRPGRTLDALGLGADARLRFAPQHRPLRLRLPNRRRLRLRLSFAQPVSRAVAHACRLLGIRHPEELSLLRAPEEEEEAARKGGGAAPEEEDFDLTAVVLPPGSEAAWPGCPPHLAGPEAQGCFRMLVAPRGGLGPSPPPRSPARGPPLIQRARINARWLDSSQSLMQQDVADDAELLLRFKYYCFLDIQPQLDAVRIAQLYEQARWSLLLEEIDCTEEEMMLFAALQYHIDELGGSGEPGGDAAGGDAALDDLDAALDSLELKLGGPPPPQLEDLTAIPELREYLDILRPRKLALRGFRPHWAVFKETTLSYYKSPEALAEPVQQLNLKGCEVIPDVNVAAQKFCIKLLVPAPDGMSEVQLRCRDAQQYARWVAGCRLAARGRTMADGSFGAEARGVLALLGGGAEGAGAGPGPGPAPGPASRPPPDPRVLLPPRFQRKIKAKQLPARILEQHQRVAPLSGAEARLRFLQAWQALPDFGLAYFLVRFKGSRKDEVLGVAPNRLVRLEPALGSVLRTWRYSSLRQWNVNWDSRQVAIEFDEHVNVAFSVVSAPCRTVHEYLGGYICLASRAKGRPFDEELFHKLTGGQEAP